MGMRVYTTGVFDLLHRGHLNILTQAASLGELYVGIMTDEGVERAKGSRPILSLAEREAQIRSLPFVAEVIRYTETDQNANYEAIRPQIVVQGDDWLFSADRTNALNYLRENAIRLVLLPRTDGISTTEIRKRVARSVRRDEKFLLERVVLRKLSDLRRFEAYEQSKVTRLQDKLTREGVFTNPLSIVTEGIVIDGANRLEALTRLGARFVPCVVYDYAEVDLVGNVHFVSPQGKSRMSEFARETQERIEFPRRTPDEIRAAVKEGRLIPNGETFHRVPQSVIRLPIALEDLKSNTPFDIAKLIQERIATGQIRFYQSSVYVCDEW